MTIRQPVSHSDFQLFLIENDLEKLDAEEIARRLCEGKDKKYHVDGATIRNVRHKRTLTPRISWKLWVLTDKKVKSFKPKVWNPLVEFIFENDLTPAKFSDLAGVSEGTLHHTVYRNGRPTEAVREKIYRVTKLPEFAPQVSERKVTSARRILERVEEDNSVELRVARLEKTVSKLKEPSSPELVAMLFEGLAEIFRNFNGVGNTGVGYDFETVYFDPKTPEVSFENILHALTGALNFFSEHEQERKNLKGSFDPSLVLRLATGLAALIKEADFQLWLQSGVEL